MMRFPVVLLLAPALSSFANAHYLFGRLILDGRWTETWEYVREISPAANMDAGIALIAPNTEPNSPDIRCGRNASVSWNKPKTATIKAGDTIGFAAGEPVIAGADAPRMYHPGFASAWLSKSSTDDLNNYAGDGDWFKILSVTGRTGQSLNWTGDNAKLYNAQKAVWGTFQAMSWNFTIPRSTPSGKYLLRFEHIFPNPQDAQYYPNCAHVEIISGNNEIGTPGPLVKIPGAYQRGQSDVYFSTYDPSFNITTFVPPKPAVWTG